MVALKLFDLAMSQVKLTSQFAIFNREMKSKEVSPDDRGGDYGGTKQLTKKAIDGSSLTSFLRSGKPILMFLIMILYYRVKFAFVSRFSDKTGDL